MKLNLKDRTVLGIIDLLSFILLPLSFLATFITAFINEDAAWIAGKILLGTGAYIVIRVLVNTFIELPTFKKE
ncbi:MAG: hypothetical protein HC917_10530 [Richelia sp. SM2_1_7]|nr:hypothetical protein [Richelia sp. SM2_1_7]